MARNGFEQFVTQSASMADRFDKLARAAQTSHTVFIHGESGTGKELAARAVHANSPRSRGPFVALNIAAVPDSLLESELFGHVAGAFTGATTHRMGRFEAAHGGTLFLDEIGDCALASQPTLLRALDNRHITPVGGNTEIPVDVRIVTATSRDLPKMIGRETFRADLYYRLAVVCIDLPALRERPDDVELLAEHFVQTVCDEIRRSPVEIAPSLMQFLRAFDWPGNVRQLKNLLESMVVQASGSTLTCDDIPTTLLNGVGKSHERLHIPHGTQLVDLERIAIRQELQYQDQHRERTAAALGISVRTLQRKLNEMGLLPGPRGSTVMPARSQRAK